MGWFSRKLDAAGHEAALARWERAQNALMAAMAARAAPEETARLQKECADAEAAVARLREVEARSLVEWERATKAVHAAIPGGSSARPVREPIPERVRHEVWRRDEGRCVDCGSRERLEFDHIVPVAAGGSNT